ncbi:hypothetical protein ZHAS_00022356 [Anopheles sinensis]|uniref:C2H2-type domain-containing protein n=1 Tax=Anopheles sinensis TaxID=74873 RepID=A0A084WUD7_ANOSI|nr:hypothetical protein ZHAS_00022356 [Anopheles sinensis]
MSPHTQTAAGGGITIKQPFQPHHQWPWATPANGTGGGTTAGGTTTTTTPNSATATMNGNSISNGNSVVSNGTSTSVTAQVDPQANQTLNPPPPTITAFASVAGQSASTAGGSNTLLRPAGSSGNSAVAVSPSNKLKRLQPNASSVGSSAAAAIAPTTTTTTTSGVQTDGTGKSNSTSSNSNVGANQPVANTAAKRARPNSDAARIVCKSVGTNTSSTNGGPPALVAVGAGKPLLSTPVTATQKKLTQMAIVTANPAAKNGTTTVATATTTTGMAGSNGTSNNLPTEKATKITGYFKSQMKTTNTFNNLKKNIKTVAGRAFTMQQQQQQQKKQLLANGVSEPKPDDASPPTPQSASSSGTSPQPFSDADVEKYLKRYQQQTPQLIKTNGGVATSTSSSPTTTALEAVAVATLVAAAASSNTNGKKVERKTARIAPTVSATRKISHTVQGGLGVGAAAAQGKKPVSIAPRTTSSAATNTEAKVPASSTNNNSSVFGSSSTTTVSFNQSIVATSSSTSSTTSSVLHQQKTDQMIGKVSQPPPPPVLLTAIRQQQQPATSMAVSQFKQTKPVVQSTGGKLTPVANPALFQFHHQQTGQTTIPIPNLVQISNLLPLATQQQQHQQQQQQAAIASKLGMGGGVSLALTAAQTSSTTTTSAAAALAFASALGAATPSSAAATANLLVNANARAQQHHHHQLQGSVANGVGGAASATTTTAAPQLVMNATFIKIHQIQQQQQQQQAAAAAAQQAAHQQQQQAAAAQQQLIAAATSTTSSQQQQSFTMEASAMNMNFSGMFAKPTTTVVPYSCQPGRAGNGTSAATTTLYPAQLSQFAQQQQQQLIMTPTGGIFVNAAAIPAMISSQLSAFTQATANIPALHPLQPAGPNINATSSAPSNNQATTSGQLPNITAIIQQNGGAAGSGQQQQQQQHHHHHHHHHHTPQHNSLLANISPAILSNLQQVAAAAMASSNGVSGGPVVGGGAGSNGSAGKLPATSSTSSSSVPAAGPQFVPISAAAHLSNGATLYAATHQQQPPAPPPGTMVGSTAGLLAHHHHHHPMHHLHHHHHGAQTTQSLSPPPLVATVPTFTTTGKPIMNATIPNGSGVTASTMLLATTTSSSSAVQQKQPTLLHGGEPPGLVPVQLPKQQQPNSVANLPKLVRSATTTTTLGRSNGSTQTQPMSASSPPALNPLTLDCGSSNDSGIVANSSDSEDKSLTIDLCSPGSPDDSSTGGKKDDEEAGSSTSGAGSSKGSESRTTPSQSPPPDDDDDEEDDDEVDDDDEDDEDDCRREVTTTTTAAATTTSSTVAAVSPFPPPLRLLSDVAVAAAEVEAAFIHQRRFPTMATLTIPSSGVGPSQQHSPKSKVMELIRQKHLQQQKEQKEQQHTSMELDEDETCSSAKDKDDQRKASPRLNQSTLDEQQPQESSMSTASGASDLQEDYTSTSTRSLPDNQQKETATIKEEKQLTPFDQLNLSPPSIETDLLGPLAPEAACARSPILSQPKTIRFPAPNGTAPHHNFGRKGFRRSGDGRLYGACYWRDCDAKFDSSTQLLDHLQIAHVNTQKGPRYACLWDGCKVHNKECTKFNWLEKHVQSHGCSKPHKCIVAGCGMRFASQPTLLKHVNSHFANADNASSSKRSSDPPVPKVLRKTGKKLRYRRQPWSARRFDFFDAGVMEGLQHRLLRIGTVASGPGGAIVFRGKLGARRQTAGSSEPEILVRWWPTDILPDEWIPESTINASRKVEKQVSIRQLTMAQRNDLADFFREDRLNPKSVLKADSFAEIHTLSLMLQQQEQQQRASIGGGSGSSGSSSNLSAISSSSSSSSNSNTGWSNLNSPAAPFNSRTAPKQQRKPPKQNSSTTTSGFQSISSSSSPASSVSGGTGFSSIFSTSRTTTSGSVVAGRSSCDGSSQGSCGGGMLLSSSSGSSNSCYSSSSSSSSSSASVSVSSSSTSSPSASNCPSKAAS